MWTITRRPPTLAALLLLLAPFDSKVTGCALVDARRSDPTRDKCGRRPPQQQQQQQHHGSSDSTHRADTCGSSSLEGRFDGDGAVPSASATSTTIRITGEGNTLSDGAIDGRAHEKFASSAGVPGRTHPSPPTATVQHAQSRVSAVLVLTVKDAHVATLLLGTLRACGAMDLFRELFVVVPSGELAQIEAILLNNDRDTSTTSGKSTGLYVGFVRIHFSARRVGFDASCSTDRCATRSLPLFFVAISERRTRQHEGSQSDKDCDGGRKGASAFSRSWRDESFVEALFPANVPEASGLLARGNALACVGLKPSVRVSSSTYLQTKQRVAKQHLP